MGSCYLEDFAELYNIQVNERDLKIHKYLQYFMAIMALVIFFNIVGSISIYIS